MKYILFTILILTNLQVSAQSWKTTYFRGPARQEQSNWCVHACLAMTFNFSQCVSVNHWIRYHSGLNPDCCNIPPFSGKDEICVSEADIPRYELGNYLRKNYRPIEGALRPIDEFPFNRDVAYLAIHYSEGSHLTVLIEVEKVEDYMYQVTYCDPTEGRVIKTTIPGNIEVLY